MHVWRVLWVLEHRGRQGNPWLRVLSPDVRNRPERRRVVEGAGIDRVILRRTQGFAPECGQATGAPGHVPFLAVGLGPHVQPGLTLGDRHAPVGHSQCQDKTRAAGGLAFRAVTAEKRDRVRNNLIAYVSAQAATL